MSKVKQETLQLTGGNTNDSRRDLDFYPTPKNATIALLDFLKLSKERIIWEPCCGNHKMSNVFKEYGHEVIATDIIYGDDYFETFKRADAIITNPPFNLSEGMIKKAVSECRIVAMLLKSQYWHAKSRQALFQEHPPTYVLPLTWRPDFLEDERKEGEKKGAPTMEVAWSVWMKPLNGNTIYQPLLKP